MRSLIFAAAAVHCGFAQSSNNPQDVAKRALGMLTSLPFTADLWSWQYGPAIEMSAMWEITKQFNQDWSSSLNTRLDQMLTNSSYPAYKVLNNITMPWDSAIGDYIGLMPIAYLSRAQFYGKDPSSPDWQVAQRIAQEYVWAWPYRLPDGTISRHSGWPGQPDNNASFLWSDDQFMGTTLLSRLALSPYTDPATAQQYAAFVAQQQVQFAQYMQNQKTGLFYHGYNHATATVSCCHWGRANGWIMMSHAEIVPMLSKVAPQHPLLPVVINIWKRQSAGLAAVQNSSDGRWHQVVNESSTFLETSATAMNLYSMATGVMGGWLDQATYDGVIRSAWAGLASTVGPDGTVSGICAGTGIGTDVAFYQNRPTAYASSSPGLGSVFRAALAYAQYTSKYGV